LTTMILTSNTPRLLSADRDAFNMQSFFSLPDPS